MTEFSSQNKQLIIDCAFLCKLAYASQSIINMSWKTLLGNNKLAECPTALNCDITDAQGICCKYEQVDFKSLVIVFRGTSSVTDAVADLNVAQVPLKSNHVSLPVLEKGKAFVHKGFQQQYLALEKQMIQYITYALAKDSSIKHIILSGHSLGTGLAAIAASVIKSIPICSTLKIAVITYGNPRMGNMDFVQYLHKNTDWSLEVKHGRDPVISILPNIWGYMHPCAEKRQIGRVDPYPDSCNLFDLVDHYLDNYIKALQADPLGEKVAPMTWMEYAKSKAATGYLNYIQNFWY